MTKQKPMTIGFLGAGKMGEAILSAVLQTKLAKPANVIACDKMDDRRAYLKKTYKVVTTDSAADTIKGSNVLIIAVKPQDLTAMLAANRALFTSKHLVISIAAGKTLKVLRKGVGPKPRLIRVMPNLALMVKQGMSVYAPAANAKPMDKALAAKIFGGAGVALELPEKQLDAVTALSGSGPAYVAYFIQAMIDGAVALKMPPAAARLLAEQTFIGAATFLKQTGSDISKFIAAACTPGGTTAAGMAVLGAKPVIPEIVAKTLKATADRSSELSRA